jgi:hypothetical protein
MPKSKSTTIRSTPPVAAAAVSAPAPGSVQLAHYLPVAQKIATNDIRPMRREAGLVTGNAARGVDAVLERIEQVQAELPKVDVAAIHALGDLGSALAFACGQVERFAPTPSNVKALLSQARELRNLLLTSADSLVVAGIFPAPAVAQIRKGTGPTDTANDCTALAALFNKYGAATNGKVPVTAADIAAADDVGSRLVRMIRNSGVKKTADKDMLAAIDNRDRIWTMFETSWHDNVWRAGAWLFGTEVETHVPMLQSRLLGKRTARGTTPPVAAVTAPVAATSSTATAPTAQVAAATGKPATTTASA